jgi:hypothetical protein
MSDPIDFITHNDIETLYAYGVAVLAIGVCAVYALKLSSTREDRDFWHTQYEALNELRNNERDHRLGRTSRRNDPRSMRDARRAQWRIAEEDDAGTFDQPTATLPAWLIDPPATTPDLFHLTPTDIAALADQTAEVDMAAYLGEYRVPALAEGVSA